MREIKFKVYSKKENRMYDVIMLSRRFKDRSLVIHTAGNLLEYPVSSSSVFTVSEGREKDYILVEYTGVKDNNKEELYEGDIIENANRDLRIILWAGNGFEMRLLNGNREEGGTIWYFDVKKVGNIHENPELLKK